MRNQLTKASVRKNELEKKLLKSKVLFKEYSQMSLPN